MIGLADHYRAKTARHWGGPGIGWINDPAMGSAFANAIFAIWIDDQVRAGRFPGNPEKTMTAFKFPMGAAVVLTTSFKAARDEAAEHDQQLHDEAARAARSVYRAAGRRDLANDDGSAKMAEWGQPRLITYRQPIEGGTVIGRSEYQHDGPQYLVRYRAGDGRQTEAWFADDALEFDPRVPSQPTEVAAATDGCDDRALNPRV